MRRRQVLYPYGQPGSAYQPICEALVHRCGGDLHRIIDDPCTSLEVFARHVARIRTVASGAERPLVVLTRALPVDEVVRARRMLEDLVPALAAAAWLVFVEPRDRDSFFESAGQMGILDARPEQAPIWTAADGSRYLVLCSEVDELAVGEERVLDLERRRVHESGPQLRDGVSAPVTAPPRSGDRARVDNREAITEPPPATKKEGNRR